MDVAHDGDYDAEHHREDHTGNNAGDQHVTDGDLRQHAVNDEHHGGRDDRAQHAAIDGEAGGEADGKADSDADSDAEVNATAPGQNDATDEVTEYTRSQAFFGRFAIFACIGLAQSTLAVLGLIFSAQLDAAPPIPLPARGRSWADAGR